MRKANLDTVTNVALLLAAAALLAVCIASIATGT
jgi:hypothetical protein